MSKQEMEVWVTRNMPSKVERQPVGSVDEAKQLLRKIIAADLKNPLVHTNAMGLEVFSDGEWQEWYDEQGKDIMEIINQEDDP